MIEKEACKARAGGEEGISSIGQERGEKKGYLAQDKDGEKKVYLAQGKNGRGEGII
jgi:hypothetical protein